MRRFAYKKHKIEVKGSSIRSPLLFVCSVAHVKNIRQMLRDSIFRSSSSPAANVNDLKVNWVPRWNLMSNVQGDMVFPGGSLALPSTWHVSVDVVSLDTHDDDRKKHDYAKSISRMNTTMFRLIQTLSKNNNPTSSIVVLCCRKIGCPWWVTDYYLYSLDNRLIDMI
jgi:hypothetical protein